MRVEMNNTLNVSKLKDHGYEKVMLSIFKDHEYTLLIQNDLLQPNHIDMIHLTTQLSINSHYLRDVPPSLVLQTDLCQNNEQSPRPPYQA